ncbi:hypothetical protein COOONC_11779 [Cooperia oncophora]
MCSSFRESDLNASLSTFNVKFALEPQTNAMIDEAFDFIRGVKEHSSVRTVILVGVSDAYVQNAQQSAKQLAAEGYSIFTVSIGNSANFSSLATSESFVYELVSPSSTIEATSIAASIGTTLVEESSVCFRTPQPTTVTPAIRSTTSQPSYSTTPACATPVVQLDIAFVVEISTSTGNLDASHKWHHNRVPH